MPSLHGLGSLTESKGQGDLCQHSSTSSSWWQTESDQLSLAPIIAFAMVDRVSTQSAGVNTSSFKLRFLGVWWQREEKLQTPNPASIPERSEERGRVPVITVETLADAKRSWERFTPAKWHNWTLRIQKTCGEKRTNRSESESHGQGDANSRGHCPSRGVLWAHSCSLEAGILIL